MLVRPEQRLLLLAQLFVLAPRQRSLTPTAPLSLGQLVVVLLLAAGVGVRVTPGRPVFALVPGVVAVAERGRVDRVRGLVHLHHYV